eukprot:g4810.t1
MGCGASNIGAPPRPANAVDIVADKPGADPTHSSFDVVARAAFMPEELRPFVTPQEYEEVMREVNAVIWKRTESESCCPPCPPKFWLLRMWLLLIITIFAAFDWIVAQSIKKLDACDPIVKKWEKNGTNGIVVIFYKGVPSLHPQATPNLIRVHIAPTRA